MFYTKQWLKDFKKALKNPNFKIKPPKELIIPEHLLPKEKAILREAQFLIKNS